MTVIDLPKRRRHAPHDLVAIDKTSGPARFYDKMRRDIAADLGGRRNMTRIEAELIKAFCGCATRLEYLTFQIMLGDASECDVAGYAQLAQHHAAHRQQARFNRVAPRLVSDDPYDELEEAAAKREEENAA